MTNDEKRIIQLETENSLLRDLLREERNRKEVSTAPIWPNTAGINNPPFSESACIWADNSLILS